MIIDTHIHLVGAGRSFTDLRDKVSRIEDVINLNSRFPELFQARHIEDPVDISDDLVADFDQHASTRGSSSSRRAGAPTIPRRSR